MSSPFLIWTMQRTGGTSLTELLMEMSEHRSAEHEPFNWAKKQPRQFWPITEAWNTSHNADVLRASLEGLFAQGFLIKHCYELLSMSFNMHLMQAAVGTPYRHVVLRRRDEPSRLVSKFIAESQGTWFKDYARKVFTQVAEGDRKLAPLPVDRVVGHYRHSEDSTKFINDTLASLDVPRLEICYEDLYTGTRDARLGHLNRLFGFLGFSPEDVAEHRARIDEKIFQSGQNTGSVASLLPNLGDVLEGLQSAGCDISQSPPRRGGRAARAGRVAGRAARPHRARMRRLRPDLRRRRPLSRDRPRGPAARRAEPSGLRRGRARLRERAGRSPAGRHRRPCRRPERPARALPRRRLRHGAVDQRPRPRQEVLAHPRRDRAGAEARRHADRGVPRLLEERRPDRHQHHGPEGQHHRGRHHHLPGSTMPRTIGA